MLTRWRILVTGILVAWLLACSGLAELEEALRPVAPPDDRWSGTWEGPGHTLVIAPDGTLDLRKIEGGGHTDLTLPARGWDGGITVGIGPVKTTFQVQEPPHQVDGEWRMVFEGVVLVRTGPAPAGFGQQVLGLDPPRPPAGAPDTPSPDSDDP